jgi:hypothetical protein
MTDDVNAKLDAIFDARSEREAAAVRIKNETEQRLRDNLQEYLVLQESVIRPTLEAFAKKLNDRGHRAHVYDYTDGETFGGNTKSATIGIRFLVDGPVSHRVGGHDYPHVSMSVDKSGRRVHFSYSTISPNRGGSAGGDGEVDFQELNVDLINKKVLDVIAVVYK